MSDLRKIIYDFFQELYKSLNNFSATESSLDNKMYDLFNGEKGLHKFILDNQGILNVVWINFFNTDFSKCWFSNFQNGNLRFDKLEKGKEKEYFSNLHTLQNKKCGKDILFYKSDKYKDTILSSSNLLDDVNMSGEIFMLYADIKHDYSNELSVYANYINQYTKNDLSDIELDEKYTTHFDFVFKNDKEDGNSIIKRCELRDESYKKFKAWIYWVNHYSTKSDWTNIFYIDSVLTKISNVIWYPIKVNIAVKFSDNENVKNLNIFLLQLRKFIDHISNLYLLAAYNKKVTQESIKSAIAAIMSRNMSHNLGSHVISGTKNYLTNKNYITNIGDNKGIYRLYQYLQERMDFIAVICNSVHNHYTFNAPLNLKADILDEFAADGRDERHPSDKTKDEYTKSFLLEHIVQSEDVSRSVSGNNKMKGIEIILLRQDRNDKDKILSFTSQKNGDNDARDFNDINFSVPLGINSRHAFLTILENFIRNSAKHNHNYPQKVDKLLISILVEENDDEFIIKIFDNKPTDEKKVQELQDIIDHKIHILKESDNTMDADYKGMKEMLICTAWLNGSDCSKDWSIIERNRENKLITYGKVSLQDIKEKVLNSIVGNNTNSRKEEIGQLWNKTTEALSIQFTLPKHRFVWYAEITVDDINNETKLSESIEKLKSADFYIIKITEKGNQNSTKEQELTDTIKKSIIKMNHILPNVIFIYGEYFYIYKKNKIEKVCTVGNEDIKNKKNEKINIIDEQQNNTIEVLSWCYLQTGLEPQETLIEYKICPAGEDFGYDSNNCFNPIIHRENEKYRVPGVKDKIRLFINHNDNAEIFVKNFKPCREYYEDKMIFMEGISGTNYNYNLLINAPVKETADYYKIIQACDAKIAIIDERIFKKYKGKKFGANNLEKLYNSIKPADIERIITEMQEYFDMDLNLSKEAREIVGKISGFDANEDEVYKWMDNQKVEFDTFSEALRGNNSDSKNYVKIWLELKNIFLYDADDSGVLSDLDENKNVKLPADIDFITVHYGIIEKYADNKKIEGEDRLKKGLIQFLFETGITYNEDTIVRVAMHSGRGGFVDSQKEIPFIPVSMLDAQLDDCKYKLAQLFLNMKYKRIK